MSSYGAETSGSSDAFPDGHRVPVRSQDLLRVEIDPGDGYTRIKVTGELDHDSAGLLKAALTRALGDRGDHLEVDLAGVRFCDCAGLNVLLRIRACAKDSGVSLTLAQVGSSVQRLLALTGTRTLFTLTELDAAPPAA